METTWIAVARGSLVSYTAAASSWTHAACGTQIDGCTFINYTVDWGTTYVWEEYVGCDSPTDTLAAIDRVKKLYSCYEDKYPIDVSSCSWAALSSPSDDI